MNRNQIKLVVCSVFLFGIFILLYVLPQNGMYQSEFRIKVTTIGESADWILSQCCNTQMVSRVTQKYRSLYGSCGDDDEQIARALRRGRVVRRTPEGGMVWSTEMLFSAVSHSKATACKIAFAYLMSIEGFVADCNQNTEKKGLEWVESQISVARRRIDNGERNPELLAALTNLMRVATTAKKALAGNMVSVKRIVLPSEDGCKKVTD